MDEANLNGVQYGSGDESQYMGEDEEDYEEGQGPSRIEEALEAKVLDLEGMGRPAMPWFLEPVKSFTACTGETKRGLA